VATSSRARDSPEERFGSGLVRAPYLPLSIAEFAPTSPLRGARAEGGGPEARADAVVVAACLAEAAACGAAFVRLPRLLNDRGAKCADAVACARDHPLPR
jgi:hypothetical protein